MCVCTSWQPNPTCGKEPLLSKYYLSPHFVKRCISGFSCICKWQGLFTEMDDLAGACQKLLLLEKKIHLVGIIVSQKSVFPMVKYKSLISVCAFTSGLFLCLRLSWLSCCELSQCGAWCKSSGSPEKQVSQLFINCQVLGFRTGMWAVCKGCWER